MRTSIPVAARRARQRQRTGVAILYFKRAVVEQLPFKRLEQLLTTDLPIMYGSGTITVVPLLFVFSDDKARLLGRMCGSLVTPEMRAVQHFVTRCIQKAVINVVLVAPP